MVSYAALIAGLSEIPGLAFIPAPLSKVHPDWAFHVIEYAFFGMLLTRAFERTFERMAGSRLAFWVLVAGTLYAFSDEWHQIYVPGREATFLDIAADALGLLAGIRIWIKNKGRKKYA